MIFVYHNNSKIIVVTNAKEGVIAYRASSSIAQGLCFLAKDNPDELLVWCHVSLKQQLNILEIENLFHHKKLLLSYNPTKNLFLDKRIGYVDTSLFAQINTEVTFPTWQMSSAVGVIHSFVLNAILTSVPLDKDFDYFLCSLSKLAMPKGLLCYSEPKLLKQIIEVSSKSANSFTLFRFVKQHYKLQWVFLLFFNMMIYQRKFSILPFIFSFFYKDRSKITFNLDVIEVKSLKKVIDKATVDVIIPTIGRKDYLYDVLKDFSMQIILPNKIIVVEQNPIADSQSELDYLANEKWPFEIQHIFTHQAGACNARNLALDQTKSEWVFLADDDNRFEATLLSDVFDMIKQYGNMVVTTAYPQKKETKKYKKVIQWPTFGAGNSFIRRDVLDKIRFNKALEFGYGEDGDFGMQLRNQGHDVLYFPEPEILHLKAPIGGFRTKPVLQWHGDSIQPKPSPTVMLYQILHNFKEQRNSYKTTLFFKYYRLQKIKNPVKYYINFQKQWNRSVFWANKLKKQNEI